MIGKYDNSYNILDLPNFNNILELSKSTGSTLVHFDSVLFKFCTPYYYL